MDKYYKKIHVSLVINLIQSQLKLEFDLLVGEMTFISKG